MPTYQDNKRGIISLTAGCALFTVNDTLAKIATLVYPGSEVLFGRGVVCMICLGALVVYGHQVSWLRYCLHPYVLARAALDAAANITFIMALSRMRLADLTAINLASPLLLTVFLAFFFKEPVGWRRWTAVLVGFAGMLLLVRPDPYAMNIWAIVALVAATFSALRDTTIRKIEPHIPTSVVSFISVVAVTLAAPVMALGSEEAWTVPTGKYVAIIVVGAMFLSAGSTYAVAALRNVDITVVAPFRYSLLIWGALSGYFVFGEVSDFMSLIGALLIVGSGLYTLHRERVRHREVTAQSGIH